MPSAPPAHETPLLAREPVPLPPVRLDPPRWTITAVIPCHNRPDDARRLLHDLARLSPRPTIHLQVLLIDNASTPPLPLAGGEREETCQVAPQFSGLCPESMGPESVGRASRPPPSPPTRDADRAEDAPGWHASPERAQPLPPLSPPSDPPPGSFWPAGLAGRVERLPENHGGAGGFNEGMRRALARLPRAPFQALWLLDSDARIHPDALSHLVDALTDNPDVCAVGSALADPHTHEPFELGGSIDPRSGEYVQPPPPPPSAGPVEVEYLAACSLLVRREAVEQAGLMPEVFLNADDVAWCLDLRRRTGMRLAGVPASIAWHPRPDRMRTGARYYAARNAFDAIDRAGLAPRTRFVRAIREVARAAGQTLIARDDLAELHLRGLRDALRRRTARAPKGAVSFEGFRPWSELASAGFDAPPPRVEGGDEPIDAPDAALLVVRRLVGGIERECATVSARGRAPREWLAARTLVIADDAGFVIRRLREGERARRLAGVLARGAVLALRLALRSPRPAPIVPVRARATAPRGSLTLSIIVLSYNRAGALAKTLEHLREINACARADVFVVDNASTDASPDMVEREHPEVRLVRLEENAGVAGFNRGAELAAGEALLILDDDARPDPDALERALEAMRDDDAIGAVPLHPRHPATGRSEWPFARRAHARDDWPVMGCGNLVRASAWRMLAGYEEGYFLYRNDADLALSLLEAGWKVRFDPAWVVWHDSPQTARKPDRWFEIGTRNWVWMCRRHGRGLPGAVLCAVGWLWAHARARWRPRAHRRVLRGAWDGLVRTPPPLPRACQGTGWAMRRLLRLRLRGW